LSRRPARLGEIETRILSRPKAKKPVLVCGLPGSGYVGKLGADYLVKTFKAQKIAEYYSPTFPPHVTITDDGQAHVMKAEVYHCGTKQAHDLLIFTADAQPTTSKGEYELSDSILKLAKRYSVKTVYSLAAYITGGFSKQSRVFGTATSGEILEVLSKNGIQVMKEGGITGMNGIIIGMAPLHGMEGICLLGETSGYLIDAGASQSVLEAFAKLLKMKIDMSGLQEKAKETQQIIGQIQKMTDQPREPGTPEKPERQPGYIG
jgi:uncharacterized protein (TIGR00162 family)